jgi:signal transduction histidine kinase
MVAGDRVRKDPIALLVWIEAVAIVAAAAVDVSTIVLNPTAAAVNRHIYPFTALAVVVCVAAMFAIPHAPNRRYAAAAIACVALFWIGWLPPDGISAFVLAAILAARLTFAFGPGGAITAWISACVALTLTVYSASSGPDHVGNAGPPPGFFGYAQYVVPFAILLGLIFGMIALMKMYASRSADVAATNERARIALDLHDFLGHGLTTLRVQLQNAERYRESDPAKADDYVRRAVAASGTLLSDVRETVASLHDNADRNTPSFAVLFERLCSDFASTHPTAVERNLTATSEPSGRIGVALYRTLQEALTNVARHAGATHVWVRVHGDERTIEASLEDDGCGISLESAKSGHGLTSMRERIASVGGQFSVGARDGGGTIVRATVPVEAKR